jgi:hypothetical protein
MLQNAQHDVAYCHQRAEESRRMAARETNPGRRQEFLDMEARWTRLATSYEFSDRLNSQRIERSARPAS